MSENDQAASRSGASAPPRLKDAMRLARIEMADRTGVVIDLRDAELARLELLNEALDPVFADVPAHIELFDRGVVAGDPPRLWIDMLAHVVMGRDKRVYRFLQETRHGRRILAESAEIPALVAAVTAYVARRLVERERQLQGEMTAMVSHVREPAAPAPRRRGRMLMVFAAGFAAGAATLFALAWLVAAAS